LHVTLQWIQEWKVDRMHQDATTELQHWSLVFRNRHFKEIFQHSFGTAGICLFTFHPVSYIYTVDWNATFVFCLIFILPYYDMFHPYLAIIKHMWSQVKLCYHTLYFMSHMYNRCGTNRHHNQLLSSRKRIE
jgi:hypothetical protein